MSQATNIRELRTLSERMIVDVIVTFMTKVFPIKIAGIRVV